LQLAICGAEKFGFTRSRGQVGGIRRNKHTHEIQYGSGNDHGGVWCELGFACPRPPPQSGAVLSSGLVVNKKSLRKNGSEKKKRNGHGNGKNS